MPTLLVVTGAPCSGKSTLADRLSAHLHWPLLAKDTIKESLFDSLGWSDRPWSKRLSGASYALMFDMAHRWLATGHGCIIEGNLRWHENEQHFARLLQLPQVDCVQVFCRASPEAIAARWHRRIENRQRHPGHVDDMTLTELNDELQQRPMQPLPLGSAPLYFDSSDGSDLEAFILNVSAAVR